MTSARVTLDQDAVKLLVPGGGVGGDERMRLVVDLLELSGEAPEVDVNTMRQIIVQAARVVFADGLLLAAWDELHDAT